MVLAVEAGDLHVDDGEAEHAAVLHRLVDALLDRGDELAGDRAADDLVDELEAGAALERLDPQERHAELAVPAGLLLVLALGLGLVGDGLAVRDLHVLGLDLDAELAVQRARARCRGASRPCPRAASGASPRCARRGARGPRRARRCSALASLSSSLLDFAP